MPPWQMAGPEMSTRFIVTAADEMTPSAQADTEARSAVDVPPRTADADRLDPHLVSLLSPQSFEADQYRVLRHFLDQASVLRW